MALTLAPGMALAAPTSTDAGAASPPVAEASRIRLSAGAPSVRAERRINVRAEPSTSAPVVVTVPPGTVLDSPGIVVGRPWIAVARDGRLFGYVAAGLVAPVPSPVPPSQEGPATPPEPGGAVGGGSVESIEDRFRAVDRALSSLRGDLDRQVALAREGFERTDRLLSSIQARLPDPDEAPVVMLRPPPTRLDIAIGSVRGMISRLIGD
ncbi:hypothetical protein N825_33190 [Skermanella stibiiresistens SB22]|uniref:Uncharacterized protein n=1 Tax=Skermanella stibiiresistens SB22 TaxID=1385369 RepID=W9H7P7_9PROT|nr:hypothetical protein N825_33190 [Skermanella stibiiresistens SB22]